MSDESALRALLRDGDDPAAPLDAADIIRRARARRRPKRLAVGGIGTLAAVAFVVPLAIGTMLPPGAADMAASPMPADDDGSAALGQHPEGGGPLAENPWPGCHLPLPAGAAVAHGVELHVAEAPDGQLVLTLDNGTDAPLRGVLAEPPTLVFSDGERPAGSSAAPVTTSAVSLAPGESLTLRVPVAASDCDGEPLPAGRYGAEAALAIRLGDGSVVVASSERTPVRIGAAE